MKKIFTLAITLLNILTCVASGPKYDAVYHLISKSYTLNADGSTDYHYRKELKLNTIASFDLYGETFICYNPEFQKLVINEAYTIRKDGSKVNTPSNAFNPSLPPSCTDCERFNQIREMVVTHTALEIGATIVLDYTIHSQNVMIQDFNEKIELYENEPIEQYIVQVQMPADHSFYSELTNIEKNITTSNTINSDGTRTYYWSFNNLAQNLYEAYLPNDYLPTLSFIDKNNKYNYLTTIAKQHSLATKCPNIFGETLAEILKDTQTTEDSVMAIRDYIAQNIHTNNVDAQLMNHIFASAQTVWSTNCGSSIEKDILFRAMLNAVNLPCSFGFINNEVCLHPQSAVRVKIGQKIKLLSTAQPNEIKADFITLKGVLLPAEIIPAEESKTYSINVAELTGSDNEMATLERLGHQINALRLETVSHCPMHASAISLHRTSPVQVNPIKEVYTYHIALPSQCEWITKPYVISKDYSFGTLNIAVSINGNLMTITRELSFSDTILERKSQIRQLREMLGEWDAHREYIYQQN